MPDELSAEQVYLFRFPGISRMVSRTHALGVIRPTLSPRHLIVRQRDTSEASASANGGWAFPDARFQAVFIIVDNATELAPSQHQTDNEQYANI